VPVLLIFSVNFSFETLLSSSTVSCLQSLGFFFYNFFTSLTWHTSARTTKNLIYLFQHHKSLIRA